jgi:TonB-dependent SusC/RagA subfamily outer membrane receptor
MNKRILILGVLCTVLFSALAVAQTGTVRGRVTDKKTGDALQGARVTLTSQADPRDIIGRVTGKDGSYEIPNVKVGRYEAQITYVGYKTGKSNISVDGGQTVTFNGDLIQDVRGLDEVVVTGVASRTSKAVAEVAVGRVNAAELTDKMAYASSTQLLNGKVSGVTITQASGNVGGGIRFNVRSGAGLQGGDPTIFVDGVRVASGNFTGFGVGGQQVSALADLNPNDIEDIQILKGAAAAALYGTSGQNGVVLIKTKRGRNLQGTNDLVITAQAIGGWNENARPFTADQYLSYDTANSVTRRGALRQFNVNMQGNSGIFTYFIGYENRAEQGYYIQNEQTRQSIRANLEAVTSKDLRLSANANFVDNINFRPQNDNNLFGWAGNTLLTSPLSNPTATVENRAPRSTYNFTPRASIEGVENTVRTPRFIGSVEVTYTPSFIPGLTLRGSGGYDVRNIRNEAFFPANLSFSGVVRGRRQIFNFTENAFNTDLSADYRWNLGDEWKMGSIIGAQTYNQYVYSGNFAADTYPTELIKDIGAGDATTRTVGENFFNYREAGVFARQEASWRDGTISLSAAARWDFASTVGTNAPNIFYPQASAAVRLDKLISLPEGLNLLKARVAYGESGRLPGLRDAQSVLWRAQNAATGAGATVDFRGNPGILPERTREIEMGVEFEFENAYGAEFSYYLSNSAQSLVAVPQPPSSGFSGLPSGNRPSNLASINGWGFESEFYARPIQTKDFGLDLKLIVNYTDNRVGDLGAASGGPQFIAPNNINFVLPGWRRGQFFSQFRPLAPRFTSTGYISVFGGTAAAETDATRGLLGVRPSSGPILDTNGVVRDGLGNIIGYPVGPALPIFTGSFSVNFRFFKDFTLYALAEYALGGYVFNQTKRFGTQPGFDNNPRFAVLATQLGIFGSVVPATSPRAATDRGPAAQVPVGRVPGVTVLTPGTPEYQRAAQEFVLVEAGDTRTQVWNFAERADWLRIREVSLRYNAAPALNEAFGWNLRSLSFAGTVNNLALFTTYSGPEVEVNTNPGGSAFINSVDFLTAPQSRTYSFMVSLGF